MENAETNQETGIIKSLFYNIKRGNINWRKVFLYILIWGLCVLYLLPFLWVLSSSLKSSSEIFSFPPKWIPDPIRWDNYPRALKMFPFHRYFFNSVVVAGGSILGGILSATLVGYAFAKYNFKLKNFWFIVLLSTMMIPFQAKMIPMFLIFRRLGMIDTYWPLLLPEFFGSPWLVFLSRQFFMTIPDEISDAGRVDGCSEFRIYWNLILPLTKPLLAAIAIFEFMFAWKDFIRPLIYLNSQKLYTVAVALQLYSGSQQTEWSLQMAATAAVILPALLLFFFAQRYFIKGITMSGMKG